jgi:hypothetical protein
MKIIINNGMKIIMDQRNGVMAKIMKIISSNNNGVIEMVMKYQ